MPIMPLNQGALPDVAESVRAASLACSQAEAEAAISRAMVPLVIASLLVVAVFLALCGFVQPQSDDYIYALDRRAHGWAGSQAHAYETWIGRFTAMFLLSTAMSVPDLTYACRILSCLLVVACLGAGCALARAWLPTLPARWTALLGAGGFAAYASVSVPREGFYWVDGGVCYVAGLAFAMAGCACAIRAARRPRGRATAASAASVALMALLAVGCCEIAAPLLGIAAFAGWFLQRREQGRSAAWGALLVGVAIGAAIVLAAPGNAVRLNHEAASRSWWEGVRGASAYAASAVCGILGDTACIAYAMGLAPIAARLGSSGGLEDPARKFWWCLAACVIGTMVGALLPFAIIGTIEPHVHDGLVGWTLAWATAAWICGVAAVSRSQASMRTLPGLRIVTVGAAVGAVVAMLLSHGHLAAGLLAISVAACGAEGIGTRTRAWAQVVLAGILAAAALRDAGPDLALVAPRWQAVWTVRYERLRLAAEHHERLVVLPRLPDDAWPRTLILTELSPNPDYRWNLALARWHGVERIWLEDPLPSGTAIHRRWERQLQQELDRLGQDTLGGAPGPNR